MSVSRPTNLPANRPDFTQFKQVSQRAVSVGGAVRFNKSGQFVVKGGTWMGRSALWLKAHIMPSRVHQENMQVLNAVARSLDQPGASHTKLARALQELGGREIRRRGNNPSVFTRQLHVAAGKLEKTLLDKGYSIEQGNNALAPPDVREMHHSAAHRASLRRHSLGRGTLEQRQTSASSEDVLPSDHLRNARTKLERKTGQSVPYGETVNDVREEPQMPIKSRRAPPVWESPDFSQIPETPEE